MENSEILVYKRKKESLTKMYELVKVDFSGIEVFLTRVFAEGLDLAGKIQHRFNQRFSTDEYEMQNLFNNGILDLEKDFNYATSYFCHLLVFSLLGLPLKLKYFKYPNPYEKISNPIFSQKDFKEINSLENLKQILNEYFKKDFVVVCAISDGNSCLHSLFFIKVDNEILCVQKLGYIGSFSLINLNGTYLFDYEFKDCSFYGNKFAFKTYGEVILNPEPREIVEEFNSRLES